MTCLIEGCEAATIARGLCSRDYQKFKSQGILDEVATKVHPPCQRCGGVIPSSRRYGAQFCSTSCKDAEMDARKHADAMARRASRRTTCAWCETEIEQVRADQRFCSRKCGDDWKNNQVRLRTLRAKKAARRPCQVCGEQIPAARPVNAIYCSPECKRSGQVDNPRRRHTTIEYNRRYLYGLTPEQFNAMVAAQDGRCAICRTDTPRGHGTWHVDHCHTTGKIRGLLCHHCNLALGNFKDNVDSLRAAIAYLTAAESPSGGGLTLR